VMCSSKFLGLLSGVVLAVWCLLVPLAAFSAAGDDLSELLMQATQAYKAGNYDEALSRYKQIAAAGVSNGMLYYNIGNACMRSGKPGLALLYYRKAALRMPRNEDLHTNIQYVLLQAHDSIDCRGYAATLRDFCFWYGRMTLNELAWTALALNALFWLLLFVRFLYRREGLAIALGVVVFLTVLFGASAAVKYYSMTYAPGGVVVAPEVQVRSGTSLNDTVLFRLHEAAECVLEEERDGWVRISLCDGKKGWVQADVVVRID